MPDFLSHNRKEFEEGVKQAMRGEGTSRALRAAREREEYLNGLHYSPKPPTRNRYMVIVIFLAGVAVGSLI